MATSKCPSCASHSFEIQEATPARSAFKLMFIQCAQCGAVVGVLDYFNIGNLIHKQNTAIQKIARAMNVSVSLDT